MKIRQYISSKGGLKSILSVALVVGAHAFAQGQTNVPRLIDPRLRVQAIVTNLNQPTTMAFLGARDLLVLEKASGRVLRITNGTVAATVLDLPVNSASERGLLGIALHPRFPRDPGVYLYWTESSTGADSEGLAEVPLLGNRVDRFLWDGSALTLETNIIQLRAFQMDPGQPLRGNHDGGLIRFGPDGKLYIYIGDVGRRGQMQNLPDGPGPAGNQPDDQFGGPEPDDAHLTGVILRLNDDGSTPRSNPFFRAGALRGGEAGANLQKVFAYGIRNGFGMAFDPFSGNLWEAQNGDDSYTELNLVEPGANLGWIQIMGPLKRLADFKAIETSSNFFGLQQIRWSPTNIAETAEEAADRLFWIFEGGDHFGAVLTGREEVPPVVTDASGLARFTLEDDGTLSYRLRATGPLQDVLFAHIHLGADGQNGPVVAFLFDPPSSQDFRRGDLIAAGTLSDADVIARPNFTPSISNLVARMRQGRAYVNLHTTANPGGEIRGQIIVTDRRPVSHYSDPEFSWRFEVAPAAVGFVASRALGDRYQGDMIVGAARDFLLGGNLFRFNLSDGRDDRDDDDDDDRDRDGGRDDDDREHDGDRDDDDDDGDRDDDNRGRNSHDDDDDDDRDRNRHDDDDDDKDGREQIAVSDRRLRDGVADNLAKFEITESESLLFGTGFGIATDILTGPNGRLYVVSLSHGAIYEISRRPNGRR